MGKELPCPSHHKAVLQGFQNLVGLKPSPKGDTYKIQNKPYRIGSKPKRENQLNNHVLTPYLQGYANLAGLETGR
tara:strand:- start:1004 stop:1228 length:225 start_codon:yes stop_codon:yes gene_type:complete